MDKERYQQLEEIDEWDLDSSSSDNESLELEMTQDDVMRIPFIQEGTKEVSLNHIGGIQPKIDDSKLNGGQFLERTGKQYQSKNGG